MGGGATVGGNDIRPLQGKVSCIPLWALFLGERGGMIGHPPHRKMYNTWCLSSNKTCIPKSNIPCLGGFLSSRKLEISSLNGMRVNASVGVRRHMCRVQVDLLERFSPHPIGLPIPSATANPSPPPQTLRMVICCSCGDDHHVGGGRFLVEMASQAM